MLMLMLMLMLLLVIALATQASSLTRRTDILVRVFAG